MSNQVPSLRNFWLFCLCQKMKYVSRLSLQSHISGNSRLRFNFFDIWVIWLCRMRMRPRGQKTPFWVNIFVKWPKLDKSFPAKFYQIYDGYIVAVYPPARFDNRRKPRYFWPSHQKFCRKILPAAIKTRRMATAERIEPLFGAVWFLRPAIISPLPSPGGSALIEKFNLSWAVAYFSILEHWYFCS